MASLKAIAAIALTLMVAVPIMMGYAFASEENEHTVWETENSSNLSDAILNSTQNTYMTYTGTTNNTTLSSGALVYVESGATPVTAYPSLSATTTSITFTAGTFVDLSAYEYWVTTIPSGVTYAFEANEVNISYGGVVSGHGGQLCIRSETLTLDVTSYVNEGTYADVSYGWKIPASPSVWENGQTNNSVRFLVEQPDDSTVKIGYATIKNTSGTVTVHYSPPVPNPDIPTYTLGDYNYLMVDYSWTSVTVYGLDSWPSMSETPTTYNKVTAELISTAADFETVRLTVSDLDTVFRVDSAQILAGTFPTTQDFTLDMASLYPDKSYELTLNSIGIYGTSLTFAGEAYTVDSGKIAVDGATVSLKGAVLSSKYDDESETYIAYINSTEIGSTAAPASIVFGGEWSLTVSANIVGATTETRAEWAPGEFAFDKEDFAACGLIVAGLCMVGLGMTGSRSGAKMGVLLIICGGAGLIYLTLI